MKLARLLVRSLDQPARPDERNIRTHWIETQSGRKKKEKGRENPTDSGMVKWVGM